MLGDQAVLNHSAKEVARRGCGNVGTWGAVSNINGRLPMMLMLFGYWSLLTVGEGRGGKKRGRKEGRDEGGKYDDKDEERVEAKTKKVWKGQGNS